MKKMIEIGGCREDLVMLGGHPTVTPPIWTTLATGCYSNVHGITGFYRMPDLTTGEFDLEQEAYNLDFPNYKAEQIWNVFAEVGKKHWFGTGRVLLGSQAATVKICMQ